MTPTTSAVKQAAQQAVSAQPDADTRTQVIAALAALGIEHHTEVQYNRVKKHVMSARSPKPRGGARPNSGRPVSLPADRYIGTVTAQPGTADAERAHKLLSGYGSWREEAQPSAGMSSRRLSLSPYQPSRAANPGGRIAIMENVTPDLLKWQEGNMTATHVLCENASLDSPIYRVLTIGSERHCQLHGYMMVDGVEEWNDERFIIPFTLGHVVGETYYSGTNDSIFKPVNRDRFVGRVYVGKAFV